MPIKRIIFIIVSIFFSGCYYDIESELYPGDGLAGCDTAVVNYFNIIEPIIKSGCYDCHSSSINLGNVNLEGYNQLKLYADNGELSGSINHNSGFSAMPKNRGKLSDCSILLIETWISKGLPQ